MELVLILHQIRRSKGQIPSRNVVVIPNFFLREIMYKLICKRYLEKKTWCSVLQLKKSPVKTTGIPVRPYLTLFSG